MAIAITDTAVKEIRRQAVKRGTPESALRVGIRGGGCTGFSYLFHRVGGRRAQANGTTSSKKKGSGCSWIPKSFVYLDGTELDFITSIMGHGFKFNNPNVKGSCGCGESVQF